MRAHVRLAGLACASQRLADIAVTLILRRRHESRCTDRRRASHWSTGTTVRAGQQASGSPAKPEGRQEVRQAFAIGVRL